ncbi:MAG: hypothetical protein U0840_28960 [Gemmataceae bacterium]
MTRLRSVFTNRHVILPIVHVTDADQARRNLAVARDGGADGAFLISHGHLSDEELLDLYLDLRIHLQGFWIGINCLGLNLEEMFRRAGSQVAGVWADDAMIDEASTDQPAAQRVLEVQQTAGWQGLYFGGVAFKYQRSVADLGIAARSAAPFMDVVTTSGPGTGQAALPSKVRKMKEALGSHPLGLASGVTPENVTDYLPWVDCFLVSTGISYTMDEFDPARVRDLVQIVRAWQPR